MHTLAAYSGAETETKEIKNLAEVSEYRKRYKTVWLDLVAPSKEEIEALGEAFGFHRLALDDCSHTSQRPKVDYYADHFFLIIKAAEYTDRAKVYQIAMFVGKDFFVSVREKDNPKHVAPLIDNIRSAKKKADTNGPDHLCYLLVDAVIDDFFPVFDRIDDEIEGIEEEIISHAPRDAINRIVKIKKDLLVFRKVLFPTMETIICIQRGGSTHLGEKTKLFFGDVYDHVVEIVDLLETSRELASGAVDIYMSRTQNLINEVAKTFAMFSIILMWPTVIGAIYGMNFREIPELGWGVYGYLFSLVLMAILMAVTYFFFKAKRWV